MISYILYYSYSLLVAFFRTTTRKQTTFRTPTSLFRNSLSSDCITYVRGNFGFIWSCWSLPPSEKNCVSIHRHFTFFSSHAGNSSIKINDIAYTFYHHSLSEELGISSISESARPFATCSRWTAGGGGVCSPPAVRRGFYFNSITCNNRVVVREE